MTTAVMEPGQGSTKRSSSDRTVFAVMGLFAILAVVAALLFADLGPTETKPQVAPVAAGAPEVTGSSVSAAQLAAANQTASGGVAAANADSAAQPETTATYNNDTRDVALPDAAVGEVAICTTDGGCWQPSLGYVANVEAGRACAPGNLIWRVVGQAAGETRLACS